MSFDAAIIESQPVLLAPPEKKQPLQRDSRPMRKQASQDSLSVLALVSGGDSGYDTIAGSSYEYAGTSASRSLGEDTATERSPAPSPAPAPAALLAAKRESTQDSYVLS